MYQTILCIVLLAIIIAILTFNFYRYKSGGMAKIIIEDYDLVANNDGSNSAMSFILSPFSVSNPADLYYLYNDIIKCPNVYISFLDMTNVAFKNRDFGFTFSCSFENFRLMLLDIKDNVQTNPMLIKIYQILNTAPSNSMAEIKIHQSLYMSTSGSNGVTKALLELILDVFSLMNVNPSKYHYIFTYLCFKYPWVVKKIANVIGIDIKCYGFLESSHNIAHENEYGIELFYSVNATISDAIIYDLCKYVKMHNHGDDVVGLYIFSITQKDLKSKNVNLQEYYFDYLQMQELIKLNTSMKVSDGCKEFIKLYETFKTSKGVARRPSGNLIFNIYQDSKSIHLYMLFNYSDEDIKKYDDLIRKTPQFYLSDIDQIPDVFMLEHLIGKTKLYDIYSDYYLSVQLKRTVFAYIHYFTEKMKSNLINPKLLDIFINHGKSNFNRIESEGIIEFIYEPKIQFVRVEKDQQYYFYLNLYLNHAKSLGIKESSTIKTDVLNGKKNKQPVDKDKKFKTNYNYENVFAVDNNFNFILLSEDINQYTVCVDYSTVYLKFTNDCEKANDTRQYMADFNKDNTKTILSYWFDYSTVGVGYEMEFKNIMNKYSGMNLYEYIVNSNVLIICNTNKYNIMVGILRKNVDMKMYDKYINSINEIRKYINFDIIYNFIIKLHIAPLSDLSGYVFVTEAFKQYPKITNQQRVFMINAMLNSLYQTNCECLQHLNVTLPNMLFDNSFGLNDNFNLYNHLFDKARQPDKEPNRHYIVSNNKITYKYRWC